MKDYRAEIERVLEGSADPTDDFRECKKLLRELLGWFEAMQPYPGTYAHFVNLIEAMVKEAASEFYIPHDPETIEKLKEAMKKDDVRVFDFADSVNYVNEKHERASGGHGFVAPTTNIGEPLPYECHICNSTKGLTMGLDGLCICKHCGKPTDKEQFAFLRRKEAVKSIPIMSEAEQKKYPGLAARRREKIDELFQLDEAPPPDPVTEQYEARQDRIDEAEDDSIL